MCTFIVVIRIFEVMIRSPHRPQLVHMSPSGRRRVASTGRPHCPHGDVSEEAGVCDSALSPRRLPSYVVADGASFIVCCAYCLSRLVCDMYFYCGNKNF